MRRFNSSFVHSANRSSLHNYKTNHGIEFNPTRNRSFFTTKPQKQQFVDNLPKIKGGSTGLMQDMINNLKNGNETDIEYIPLNHKVNGTAEVKQEESSILEEQKVLLKLMKDMSPSLLKEMNKFLEHQTKKRVREAEISVDLLSTQEEEYSQQILKKMDKSLLKHLKKCVVNIEQSISNALNSEKVGVFTGTGFIIDAKEGIIATNYHIAGTSPQQVKVTFENGESTEAVVLHYDVWHDFAFYKCDTNLINFPLTPAELGNSFTLDEQSEVFLIGNNDNREYSFKFGTVTNLIIDTGKRHSHSIQTSFDRTGGSSGSPVFDIHGKVVGIHTSGTNTTSFELRIEYLKDALEQLKTRGKVERGDIGVELALFKLSDACLHYNFPQEAITDLKKQKHDIKYLAHVNKIVPLARCSNILRPGDIIMELDGHLIGDNLYLFDRLVDSKVNKSVEIVIYRNGQRMTFAIPVEDTEATKITKFALFAGGVFHDLSPILRTKFEIHTEGVFMSQVVKGSCLSGLGSGTDNQPTSYATVIEEVSGCPTPTLDSFIEAVKKITISGQKHIYVLCRNLRNYRTCTKPKIVILDLKFNPLRVFRYSEQDLNWMELNLENPSQS